MIPCASCILAPTLMAGGGGPISGGKKICNCGCDHEKMKKNLSKRKPKPSIKTGEKNTKQSMPKNTTKTTKPPTKPKKTKK